MQYIIFSTGCRLINYEKFRLNFDVLQQNNILLKQNVHIYEISIKTVIFFRIYSHITRAYRMQSIRPERMGPSLGGHTIYGFVPISSQEQR